MVKMTIETEGREPLIIEGKGIVGSFVEGEAEDGAVDLLDAVIGEFNLNELTAALHNTMVAYMGQLERGGFTHKEVINLLNIAATESVTVYLKGDI